MAQSTVSEIEFLIGGNVGLPPAGRLTLHVDGTGAMKLLNSVGVDSPVGTGAAASPFGIMAAHALAWGKGLATPIDFSTCDPFQEDFTLGGLTVVTGIGISGVVTYSTNGNNLGKNGIIKVAAPGGTSSDFAIATSVNVNGTISDALNNAYYTEVLCSFSGAMSQINSQHAVGFVGATAPSGLSTFIQFGAIQAASTTKYGFAMYNGTTETFSAGNLNFDISATMHYLGIGHDPTTHAFYGLVDGVVVASMSDAAIAAIGPMTPWSIYESATTNGFILADKAYGVCK